MICRYTSPARHDETMLIIKRNENLMPRSFLISVRLSFQHLLSCLPEEIMLCHFSLFCVQRRQRIKEGGRLTGVKQGKDQTWQIKHRKTIGVERQRRNTKAKKGSDDTAQLGDQGRERERERERDDSNTVSQ